MNPDTPPLGAQTADAALGAALSNAAAAAVVAGELLAADMPQDRQRRVLAAIKDMQALGEPIDVLTVANEVGAQADERDWLFTLPERCPSAMSVRSYVRDLKRCHLQAAVHRTGLQLTEISLNGDFRPENIRPAIADLEKLLDYAGGSPSAAGAFLDWLTFWDRDHDEAEWVYSDVLARGRGHALYAAHKLGKSLIMLFIAAQLATGTEPYVCVYLDYEMTEADVRDRLEDMGYGAGTDLSRLCYALLPTLPPLDTPPGARALCALLDNTQREWPTHHLVLVIDTISRAVCGEENSADTWRDFYLHTGIELKRRGITWARLDHSGKDPERGQRGSSGKGDDVDVVWNLVGTQNGVMLQRRFARMSWVPARLAFAIREDPLVFQRLAGDWPEGTGEAANLMDRLGLATDVNSRDAQARLKAAGEPRRRQIVLAAIRWRKERAGDPEESGNQPREPLQQELPSVDEGTDDDGIPF